MKYMYTFYKNKANLSFRNESAPLLHYCISIFFCLSLCHGKMQLKVNKSIPNGLRRSRGGRNIEEEVNPGHRHLIDITAVMFTVELIWPPFRLTSAVLVVIYIILMGKKAKMI